MQTSLKLSSNEYATGIALLFVGYIIMQLPSNIYLATVRPSVFIPCAMALWGVVSGLTGITQNAAGLYVTRFILGGVEATFLRKKLQFYF